METRDVYCREREQLSKSGQNTEEEEEKGVTAIYVCLKGRGGAYANTHTESHGVWGRRGEKMERKELN